MVGGDDIRLTIFPWQLRWKDWGPPIYLGATLGNECGTIPAPSFIAMI
jgi:hypothetical protein